MCLKSLVFIRISENAENRNFKSPYITFCFWMKFDFRKQNALNNVGIYRLFENREISNVNKNIIKLDDLSPFQF